MAGLASPARGAETNDASATVVTTNAATLDALVAETLERNPELKFIRLKSLLRKVGGKLRGCSPILN